MKSHIWFIEDRPEEIRPLVDFLQTRGFHCEVLAWDRSTEGRIADGSPPDEKLFMFIDAVIRGENMAEAILRVIRRSKHFCDVPVALLTGTVSSAARSKYKTYHLHEIYRKEEFVRQKEKRGKPVLEKQNAIDLIAQIQATLDDHHETRRWLDEADELAEAGQWIKAADKYEEYLSMVGVAGQEDVRHRLLTALSTAVGQSVTSYCAPINELLRRLQRAAKQAFLSAPLERPALRREAARYWLGATWHLDEDPVLLPEFAAAIKSVYDHPPLTTAIAEEIFTAIERGMPNMPPERMIDLLAAASLKNQLYLIERLKEHNPEQSQDITAAVLRRLLNSDTETALGELEHLDDWRQYRQLLSSIPYEELRTWRGLVENAVQVNQSLAYELWDCSREIFPDEMVQLAWTELAINLCAQLNDPGRAVEVARDLLLRELPQERLDQVIEVAARSRIT